MNIMIKKKVLLLFCFTTVHLAMAQVSEDEQLAVQYLNNKEYDKAAILFEKLFNHNQDNTFYYGSLLESWLKVNDYRNAEKLIKKQIKRNPNNAGVIVDLGNVYAIQGHNEDAVKQFDLALEKIVPDQLQIIEVSQKFASIGKATYAIKSLAKGKKLMKGIYSFNMEMAEVYTSNGDFANAIGEYLDALSYNTGYLAQVQSILQNMVGDELKGPKAEELRIQLLKRVQQSPDQTIFAEMIIWFFIQQRDFESAFTQSKSYDKRMNQQNGKLINLAQICVSNQEYDVAIKCYEYEVQKGTTNPFYAHARNELVNTLSKKITESGSFSMADLKGLENTFNNAINELGNNSTTIGLLRGLAHLKAFYLEDTEGALKLLETALSYVNADPRLLAECKLELGDINVFLGEMWESSLLYSQVDKAFKQEPIGQEAKFKNARLSFYKGEFEWAQAQLDVLKAATSKLIANDALNLSLLISDNTIDSNYTPLSIYARASLLAYQNYDSLALLTLDSLSKEFPDHTLNDDILYKKYEIDIKKRKYVDAADKLQNIITYYSDGILGDDAVYRLAELNENQFKQLEKAKALYQQILIDYPGSLYTVEARKRYRKMRGDDFN